MKEIKKPREITARALEYARVNVHGIFPDAKKSIATLSFVNNGLAHGYFRGAEWIFEMHGSTPSKEHIELTTDVFKAKYLDKLPAQGEDRDNLGLAFYMGFRRGVEDELKLQA